MNHKTTSSFPWRCWMPLAAACLVVTGCEGPGIFHDVSPGQPHAVLTAENPPGFRGFLGKGREVKPLFINDRRTSFWRSDDRFLIALGPTKLTVIDTAEPYNYDGMTFSARAGHHYILRPTRDKRRDAVTLSERPPNTTQERVVTSAFRKRE